MASSIIKAWRVSADGALQIAKGRRYFGTLDLTGRADIKRIPEGLDIRGEIIITGCKNLEALPEGVERHAVIIAGPISLHHTSVLIHRADYPEVIKASLPGKRLGDVVDHYLFKDMPIMDKVITRTAESLGGLILSVI